MNAQGRGEGTGGRRGEEGVGVTVCVCVYLIISTVFWCSQQNNVFPGTSDAEPDSNARQHSLKQEAMNSQGRARGRRGETQEKGVVVPVCV